RGCGYGLHIGFPADGWLVRHAAIAGRAQHHHVRRHHRSGVRQGRRFMAARQCFQPYSACRRARLCRPVHASVPAAPEKNVMRYLRGFSLPAYFWLFIAYLFAPILVMAAMGLRDSAFIAFPITKWTTHWYADMVFDREMLSALV